MNSTSSKLPYEAPAIQTLGSVQDLTLAKQPLVKKSDGFFQTPDGIFPGKTDEFTNLFS